MGEHGYRVTIRTKSGYQTTSIQMTEEATNRLVAHMADDAPFKQVVTDSGLEHIRASEIEVAIVDDLSKG